MPSIEVQQLANRILLSGLRHDDGRICIPIHEILSAQYTDTERFLYREAFEYLALEELIRRKFGSKIWFLTADGKAAAELIQKSENISR